MDPVRKWTFIVMGICIVLFAWYLRSDPVTPYTSQARVHALVVPIAPEVSGTVTSVSVSNNQQVEAGQVLFQIDTNRFELAVQTAEANLDSARQATGASSANVDAARAGLAAEAAEEGFPDLQSFAAIVEPDIMPTLALSSDYFRLTVRVTIGTYSLTMYSLLLRDSSGQVRPLIRTFGSI